MAKLPSPSFVYSGSVHTGSGSFTGTGVHGGTPREIRVLPRGDVTKPGKAVSPGAILAFPHAQGRFASTADQAESARRKALAQWLTHPENPLLWRSIVNRVWRFHFGRGLVETPSDFGKMGQLPSHPDLLDWLAIWFRDEAKGSFKQLHRLILTSRTYQQSVSHIEAFSKQDSENQFLWRANRHKLDAESIRDAILAVSGRLDRKMYGPGFQDFVIERPEHSPHYQYHLHDPEDSKSWRRSVYRFLVRSKTQPFMTALDCADPSMQVDKRNESLSPAQALALLNNRFVLAEANAFAKRLESLGQGAEDQVIAGFRIALGRNPSATEMKLLASFVKEHGLQNFCRVLFNLNEFAFVD